ncbi:CLUMA_CG020182, isoform A [Clunio marinus]|uniref:CLUMA_CG020182, isoform A n=1 Tax=Clunio marinus TaxID=568069 RepID=A0A1J1J470_9DIPT|nr:CLUMA_CG020182, isoform A [Clunio marinus]
MNLLWHMLKKRTITTIDHPHSYIGYATLKRFFPAILTLRGFLFKWVLNCVMEWKQKLMMKIIAKKQ